ncbi:stabilin-2 [Gadus morhua]|uniref:stabilin-2 n=1 Tax=Gadus morhua TaxID=8049 RepID=UPI0011B51681|nr:stabilin-2 [Gadus morhua]
MMTGSSWSSRGPLLMLLLQLGLQTTASADAPQGFCPFQRRLSTRTRCVDSQLGLFYQSCPSGYKIERAQGSKHTTVFTSLSGCSKECYRDVEEQRCCPGYWGPDCMECPERAERPCNAKGVCSDGMGGNGTCSCQDGFAGTACEDCSPNRYGQDCRSECRCVHGVCNSGMRQDGSCTCFSGYKGPACDQELPDCAALSCGLNSVCREEAASGLLGCQCAVGHQQSGDKCISINPCLQRPCHALAACAHTGPAQHVCACPVGHEGDGRVCSPVDPCQKDQAGCSAQTTRCVYDGPGASHCECLPGFHELDHALRCHLKDACTPDACHEKANCTTIKPGVTQCTCPEGYRGNGKVCYGNIMQRLRDLNTEPGGQWTGQLTEALTLFGSVSWPLEKLGPFTVFVPINRAFRYSPSKSLVVDAVKAKYLCKLHMAAGTIRRDGLKRTGVYYTLTGKAGEVDSASKAALSRIRLRGSRTKAAIVEPDVLASNGMIHLVNKLIENIPPTVDSDTQENLMKVISDYGKFSKFKSLLERANLSPLMDSPGPHTVFIPTNNAFSAMEEGQLEYLTTDEGHGKLVELVRNHVVESSRLEVYNVVSGPRASSMANQVLLFNVSENGRVSVNGMAVLEADVETRNGQLYSLDGVLIPASILPILPHRCDVSETRLVEGKCGSCSRPSLLQCPSGDNLVLTFGCLYQFNLMSRNNMTLGIRGCAPRCNTTTVRRACCPGFYSADCRPCPGGFQNPCSGHGQCMEGLAGNGTCICRPGFRGSRCHYCTLSNKCGPGCSRTCPCLQGTCDNRPDSDGRCRPDSCLPGYTGAHCERHTQACGPNVHFCHANADCDFSQGPAQCVCKPGYQGDGIMCVERDPCAAPSRGGCGSNAKCIKTGPKTHVCQCLKGWAMDQDECQPINDCNGPGRGGCHGNASCIYIGPGQSDCMCKTGYQGNGIDCEPANLCVFQNGRGCHFQATCQFVSGQWGCVCEDGYAGDGEVCYGTVDQELIAIPDALEFLSWVTAADLGQSLSEQNLTLLVPTSAAIQSLAADDKSFWTTKGNLPSMIRNHVIQGIYTLSGLMASTSPVTSLLNTSLSVGETSQAVTIGGAAITLANVAATNGLIHVIDKVLVPERTHSQGLLELLRPKFSLFRAALIQHNLTDEIELAEEYTIFAPTDSAVRDYLRTTSANVLDVNTTRYHVLLHERLLKTELQAAGYKKTMLGFSYLLAIFPRDGKLLVNSAQLNVSNLLTAKGVVHGLASVLEINRNRCDTVRVVDVVKTHCVNCYTRPRCPLGYTHQNTMERHCGVRAKFPGHSWQFYDCESACERTVDVPRCCAGFFGRYCEPCPGYDGQVCAGQGACDDGTKGTGRCTCLQFFNGTACESCVAGKYGVHCDQDCLCQSGRCMDGPLGDGTCVCEVGWKGIHCDEKVDSGADELCGAAKCHTSANCITKMSQMQCVCAAGFEGNGTDCRAIDPCSGANGHCSPHALCKRTQPGRRDCLCLPGYQGDGLVCVEIDACAQGTVHCHTNADCIHSGPNKTVCVCQQGYSGDGQVCEMIDLCRKGNGQCHSRAKCNTTAPGVRTCTCRPGWMGDGAYCKGTLREELLREGSLSFLINMMRYLPQFRLNGRGPFTIFAPNGLTSAAGFKAMKALWGGGVRDRLGYILQSHIVMGHLLTASDLAVPRNLTSLSGEVLTTGGSQGNILINEANVTLSGTACVNGIIHEIDSFLVSPSVERGSHTASPLNLTDVAARNGYTSFYKLMEETGVMDGLGDVPPVTVFLPSDRAWSSLSQQQRDFLYDPHNREQLLEYIRYHVVPSRQVFSLDLGLMESARSLQGSHLRFSRGGLDAIGALFINEGKCRVVQRNMAFKDGVAHGIDCLLTPPSLGGRCDERTSFEVEMSCSVCLRASSECPSGSKKKGHQPCDLPMLSYQKNSGCQPTCIFNQWQPKCCAGYYGRDCQACPGGAGSVCSNHGDCDAGHLGNGTCSCHDGFGGTACELCDDGRFGPACQACNCSQRGVCLDGRRGSGACFCEEGWTGAHCEVQQAAAPVCAPPCSPQGVCQDNNTCMCAPFYQGNGSTCTLVDLCAAGNGGCAAGARCRQTGVKVGCVCPAGHSGDGFYCQPVDPCSLTDNGGCHEHATCTMTGPGKKKCACKNNYIGDGVKCEVKELPINRCLQDNGACHLDGECTDLHFEDATVGVFHLRSDKGPYKLTYAGAAAACGGEGAGLASYKQLSYAQQAGLNLCSAGWLTEARVAYPTTFSNPNCGFGHVGIVDYGTRKNLSETWDTFCYRVKEVSCACKPGYVGDGYSCSGNLLQVLQSTPDFSNFYTQILNYSRSSRSGKEFVSRLSDLSTKNTLFVPDNSGLLENQTLTERDMEHHLSEGEALALSQMKNGSRLRTRQGSLTIQGLVDFMNPDTLSSCYVNERFIIDSDIVASNGVIHVIAGPLKAPPAPHKPLHVGHKAGMGVGLVLLLALVAAVLVVGYRFHAHRATPFKFSYFKDEGEQEEDSAPTPRHSNIINPIFDTSPPAELLPPSAAEEDSQQGVSNVCYDIIKA